MCEVDMCSLCGNMKSKRGRIDNSTSFRNEFEGYYEASVRKFSGMLCASISDNKKEQHGIEKWGIACAIVLMLRWNYKELRRMVQNKTTYRRSNNSGMKDGAACNSSFFDFSKYLKPNGKTMHRH